MKNEKGSTLVETVMTLSMLMIIMLSMTTLVISLKKTDERTKETKEITEYKNNISRIINDDLILLKLKDTEACQGTHEDYVYCTTLVFEDDSKKELIIDTGMNFIKYDNIKYKAPTTIKMSDVTIDKENNIFTLSTNMKYQKKTYNLKIVYPL